MADLQQLQVYYNYKGQDLLAGHLRKDGPRGYVFEYDADYLAQNHPPIAYTLPTGKAQHRGAGGLHPFFSNLISEGRTRQLQVRLLGLRQASDFELLSAFGFDCQGAVYFKNPRPVTLNKAAATTPEQVAVLASRASLSGVQPKFAARREGKKIVPCKAGELSTHIVKLDTPQLP